MLQRYNSTLSLTSALDGVGGQRHAPAALLPKETRYPPYVGPRAGLEGCGKSRPPPGFEPRTVQPVASRYTDWAIPAPRYLQYSSELSIARLMATSDNRRSNVRDSTALWRHNCTTLHMSFSNLVRRFKSPVANRERPRSIPGQCTYLWWLRNKLSSQ